MLKVIIIEGPDGTGKSTLAREVASQLNDTYTHFGLYSALPSRSVQGLRELFLEKKSPGIASIDYERNELLFKYPDEISSLELDPEDMYPEKRHPRTNMMLILADMFQFWDSVGSEHTANWIQYTYEKDGVLVLDRSHLSTIVYQILYPNWRKPGGTDRDKYGRTIKEISDLLSLLELCLRPVVKNWEDAYVVGLRPDVEKFENTNSNNPWDSMETRRLSEAYDWIYNFKPEVTSVDTCRFSRALTGGTVWSPKDLGRVNVLDAHMASPKDMAELIVQDFIKHDIKHSTACS